MPEEMCNSIDETMTYKGFLIIIVPIALLFASLIVGFFYAVSGTQSDHIKAMSEAQSDHLKEALTEQREQLKLIVETHSKTPHSGVPTRDELLAIEARFERQAQVFMAGMRENSEAVREIATLSLTNGDHYRKMSRSVEFLTKSVKRINSELGLK